MDCVAALISTSANVNAPDDFGYRPIRTRIPQPSFFFFHIEINVFILLIFLLFIQMWQ